MFLHSLIQLTQYEWLKRPLFRHCSAMPTSVINHPYKYIVYVLIYVCIIYIAQILYIYFCFWTIIFTPQVYLPESAPKLCLSYDSLQSKYYPFCLFLKIGLLSLTLVFSITIVKSVCQFPHAILQAITRTYLGSRCAIPFQCAGHVSPPWPQRLSSPSSGSLDEVHVELISIHQQGQK